MFLLLLGIIYLTASITYVLTTTLEDESKCEAFDKRYGEHWIVFLVMLSPVVAGKKALAKLVSMCKDEMNKETK